MARMLGRYQVPGCCPGTRAGREPGSDCSGGGTMAARYRKRIEDREIAAEVIGEVFPADRGWLAAIGYLKPYDLADCEHGCAGPWELCGEDCTFICHDPAFA